MSMDDVWSVQPVGHGFNLVGMPGDYSPPSRFVRLFYLRQVTDQKRLQFASQLGHLTASQLHPHSACLLPCDGVIGFWLQYALLNDPPDPTHPKRQPSPELNQTLSVVMGLLNNVWIVRGTVAPKGRKIFDPTLIEFTQSVTRVLDMLHRFVGPTLPAVCLLVVWV